MFFFLTKPIGCFAVVVAFTHAKAILFLLRGWEEDFVEPPDAPQPQQEAAQRRTIRQRSQKSKIHHFNTKFPARKVKTGSRQMRRHENS